MRIGGFERKVLTRNNAMEAVKGEEMVFRADQINPFMATAYFLCLAERNEGSKPDRVGCRNVAGG